MKIEEFKTRVARLNSLLQDPEPGMFTWCDALGREMTELIDEWQKRSSDDEPSTQELTLLRGILTRVLDVNRDFMCFPKEWALAVKAQSSGLLEITTQNGIGGYFRARLTRKGHAYMRGRIYETYHSRHPG